MLVPTNLRILSVIKVKNDENEVVPNATIQIYDSKNKKLIGLVANQNGESIINNFYLVDKGGRIVVTSVGYNDLTIPISQFDGNAILEKRIEELGNVVITGTRKKPKPVEEQTIARRETPNKPKSPVVPILLGGIGIGALILAFTKVK